MFNQFYLIIIISCHYVTFPGLFKIKEWLKDIKRDWNYIQEKEELKILKTHVALGNRYANIFLSKK